MIQDFDYNFHMRISVIQLMPWMEVKVLENGTTLILSGVLKSLLEALAANYNFTYDLLSPPDRQWGVVKNGTWTGLVGMVVRNESDMVNAGFALTEERFAALRGGEGYCNTALIIVAGGIPFQARDLFSFFKSFSLYVWLILLLFVFIVTLSVSVLETCDPSRQKTRSFKSVVGRNFWVLLGSLFCEATWIELERFPLQLVMGLWWLAVVVLMNSFTGQMKASMTLEAEPDTIDSLEELAQKSTLPAFIAAGTAYADLFKNGFSSDYREVWRRTVKSNGLIPMRELQSEVSFRKVQLGQYVIIQEESTIRYTAAQNCRKLWDQPGSFYLAEERLFPHQLFIAFRKDIPDRWANVWNFGIMRLREGGIMTKWEEETTGPWICGGAGGTGEKTITTTEFLSIMALWAMTILTSCLAFVVEALVHRWTRKRQKLKDKY